MSYILLRKVCYEVVFLTYEFQKQCSECLNTEWCRLIDYSGSITFESHWICQHCYAYLTGDLE